MKIKKDHYEYIKTCMTTKYNDAPKQDIDGYIENLKQDKRVKDINTRMRWDLFNAAVPGKFTCDNLYAYLNDDHIDTAIAKICKELNFQV